jgi:hypothetical protein
MSKGIRVASLLLIVIIRVPACAQYKGDHIPGFLGLESGTQAPPGLYAVDVVWVYPTSTVKDDNGNKINQQGSITNITSCTFIARSIAALG